MTYPVCQTYKCRVKTGLNESGYCSACVRKKTALENDATPYPCGRCKKNCGELEMGVFCELCLTWYHAICVDIPKEAYEWIKKVKGNKWFCSDCGSKVDKILDKANSLEVETKILRTDMDDVKSRLEKVEKKLQGSVKQEIGTALNEQLDIEKRKMNLVVFNLPEPENIEKTVWDLPTKIAKDTKAISEIIKEELKIHLPENVIINARRLGKLDTDSDAAKLGTPKPRPLKITLSDIKKKRDILTAAKNLRECDNEIAKKLFINPDLTPEQRKQDQQLRTEMWRRRTENKENVVIRRGEIIVVDHEVRKIRGKPTEKPSTSS